MHDRDATISNTHCYELFENPSVLICIHSIEIIWFICCLNANILIPVARGRQIDWFSYHFYLSFCWKTLSLRSKTFYKIRIGSPQFPVKLGVAHQRKRYWLTRKSPYEVLLLLNFIYFWKFVKKEKNGVYFSKWLIKGQCHSISLRVM